MWQLFLHLSDGYLLGMAVWLLLLCLAPVALIRLRRRWIGQKSRLRFVYAGLSAWLCVGMLTLPEVGFALLYDTTDSFDMTNVSHRWFKVHVEPDVKILEFSHDAGIRYRARDEFILNPAGDQKRLCFLGDSFTFGHGVPHVSDRFTERVGAAFNEEPSAGPPVEVANLAWPGTDLLWVKSVLDHSFEAGGRLDEAVYVLCLNDIEAFHDATMSRSSSLAHFEPPGFLFRDTYFFNWLYFRTQVLFQPETRGYYSFVKEYYQGEPWQRFREMLGQTSVLCRENHCRFRVAVFPFLHNLGPDYPFGEIHQMIVTDCRALGIDCLDLAPALSQHADERLTVNPFDAHPNERAHEIAATALHQWLSRTPAGDTRPAAQTVQSLESQSGE